MSLTLKDFAPPGAMDIYGEEVPETTTSALADRLPFLPVCNYIDLKNTALYAQNPFLYEQENAGLYPQMGDAYAWRRLPRFIDRFKEVREKMRSAFPNEMVLSLDIGSSVPIYSEMMRAHWLRKCGDHAHQAFLYATSNLGEGTRVTNVILEQHSRKEAFFKEGFVSCLQTALYCIPYEISGDEAAIREYLETTMKLFLANSKRFIDRKDRKDSKNLALMYEQLGPNFDPSKVQRVPLERAWRIDAVLGPTQDVTCFEKIAGTRYHDALSDQNKGRVQGLAAQASAARRKGQSVLEGHLRREMTRVINLRAEQGVGEDQATLFLDYLTKSAVDYVLLGGFANPLRFRSLDLRDPVDLVAEAVSSLDAETKMSGFYRRTIERLEMGDPDHIHDTIANIGNHVIEQTVSSITSIESYPFHADQPESLRQLEVRAEEIAQDMLNLASTLKKAGEYMTFPWGRAAFVDPNETVSGRLAKERLPHEILKKISQANVEGEFLISIEVYSPDEVQRWMSQGEFDSLLGLSPAIDTASDKLVEVLRIRRAKKATPSGKLLGASVFQPS